MTQHSNGADPVWPTDDFTRIPYKIFVDQGVYEREQERIFKGPTWSYLALTCEVPNEGDYVVRKIGDAEVVLNRNAKGELKGFVNRCAHRGATICRDLNGNAKTHNCIYHQWCYDLDGNLIGVPHRKGIQGMGGMPEDFDMADHGLETIRVEAYRDLIFGSFSDAVAPIEEYLSVSITDYIDRVFHKPTKILGYNRQLIPANWKLYVENTKDPYHASLLHPFLFMFGAYMDINVGGVNITDDNRHTCVWAGSMDAPQVEANGGANGGGGAPEEDDAENKLYNDWLTSGKSDSAPMQLDDPKPLIAGRTEFDDGIAVMIMDLFPSVVLQQIQNSLCMRKVVPMGPDKFELIWTYFGYADDDAEMDGFRLSHANMIGPAGLVSMEDGEAGRLIQQAARANPDGHSVVEMGGRGEIFNGLGPYTEVGIRAMYQDYCELMGYEVGNG